MYVMRSAGYWVFEIRIPHNGNAFETIHMFRLKKKKKTMYYFPSQKIICSSRRTTILLSFDLTAWCIFKTDALFMTRTRTKQTVSVVIFISNFYRAPEQGDMVSFDCLQSSSFALVRVNLKTITVLGLSSTE